jgi:mono/diheme cytochrome c family protein
MRQIKLGRAGIGIVVLVCAVALAAPTALAIRSVSTTPKNPGPGNIANGKVIFNEYFCASCHTLKAAGPEAYGQLGVNLNKVKGGVTFDTAKAVVLNGLPAALPLYPTQMVGYKNVLDAKQVDDVATFTSRYAGTTVTCEDSKPPNCTTSSSG